MRLPLTVLTDKLLVLSLRLPFIRCIIWTMFLDAQSSVSSVFVIVNKN